MYISLIIVVLFSIAILNNYQKYFMLFIAFAGVIMQFKSFVDFASPFQLIALLSVVCFFFIKGKNPNTKFIMPIWGYSIIMICISLFITNLVAHEKHNVTLLFSISELLLPIIFYYIIKGNLHFIKRYLVYLYVLGIIISIYGFVETFTSSNLFISFMNSNHLYRTEYLVTEVRYGLKRAQSIYSMHTTFGGYALFIGFCLAYLKFKFGNILHKPYIMRYSTMLYICTFFTGARSAILGAIVSLASFMRFKAKNILLLVFLLLIVFLFSSYFNLIFNSFVDTSTVAGSNDEMRANQLDIAYAIMSQNFWLGNGISYTWTIAQDDYDTLYGAESLWLPIMIDQGILGLISYILLFISMIVYVIQGQQIKLIYFILAFVVFNTLSSIPSFPPTTLLYGLISIVELSNKVKYNQREL